MTKTTSYLSESDDGLPIVCAASQGTKLVHTVPAGAKDDVELWINNTTDDIIEVEVFWGAPEGNPGTRLREAVAPKMTDMVARGVLGAGRTIHVRAVWEQVLAFGTVTHHE